MFRKAASVMFGKLEMDVTRDELTLTRKAHAMQRQGKTMAQIRVALDIKLAPLNAEARRRAVVAHATSVSLNMSSPDNSRARTEGRCGKIGPSTGE